LLLAVELGVVTVPVVVGLYGQTAFPDSKGLQPEELSAPTEKLEFDVASIRRNKSGTPA